MRERIAIELKVMRNETKWSWNEMKDKYMKLIGYMAFPLIIGIFYSAVLYVTNTYSFEDIVLQSNTSIGSIFLTLLYNDGLLLGVLNCSALLGVIYPGFQYLSNSQRIVRSVFFGMVGFLIAIHSALIFMIDTHLHTYGQSGVIYAFLGLVYGCAFVDIWMNYVNKHIISIFMLLSTLISMITFVILDPIDYFGENITKAYPIHIMSFQYGMVIGSVFGVIQTVYVNKTIIFNAVKSNRKEVIQ